MISKPYHKYSTDELMEVIDVFNVSASAQTRIRSILESETQVPDAGNFFRYYNPRSKTDQFEKMVCAKTGAKHVLAVNSGTSSLIAAMVGAGVGPGDEVIVPAYTFFASASAIVVAKAIPVITEIDESLTLDPVAVERNITPRTKAIMPVHMLGLPSKMDELRAIAARHKLLIIEDAAQAFGGKYKGKYLGTVGDAGCVSLDAYKVIGTGEGGLLLTDDEWLYTRAQSYHDTAACWRPDRFARERKSGELFCGENYRMPEMCAAVGIAQLKKLDAINEATRAAWKQCRAEVALPSCSKWAECNDENGVCGYTLGIIFETVDHAVKAVSANIGLGGLAAKDTKGVRDWHAYWNWEHILDRKSATSAGCPYTCKFAENIPAYSPDMCPKTKDILMRLAVMSFAPTYDADATSQRAMRLSADLKRLF